MNVTLEQQLRQIHLKNNLLKTRLVVGCKTSIKKLSTYERDEILKQHTQYSPKEYTPY